jgi:hypothetical protein
MALVGLRD